MSANLVVDLFSTTDRAVSVGVGSGSDLTVGRIIDMLGANTMCQVFATAPLGGSGAIEVRIQTSDLTTSGSFTDPTSGLAQMPSTVLSGGRVIFNSGLWTSGFSSPVSPVNNAPLFCSGGADFSAFQRPQRYARLIYVSGPFPNPIAAGFISNKKTTGSGGGQTQSPGSGVISV